MAHEKYDELINYQGKRLRDIDIHAVIDAVMDAGRKEDFLNLPIELKDDSDRIVTLLGFDYQNDDREEIVVSTAFNTYSIPALTASNEINYKAVESRIKNTLKDYEDMETYIDMKYLYDHEYSKTIVPDVSDNFNATAYDEDYISRVVFDEPIKPRKEANMEPEILTQKRTKIESDYDINLNDVAKQLRDAGYHVRTKSGGSLNVTDENLSTENSITVTKKNAYIETAQLKTPETKALYDKMRDAVIAGMNHSLESTKGAYNLIKDSSRLAEVSTQSIVSEMLTVFKTDQLNGEPDYADVFTKPKQKYSFQDPDGNDYMNLSLGYHVKENTQPGLENEVVPVIMVTYGPEYGDVTKTFEVSDADLKAFEKDPFYKTSIQKDIDAFVSIGTKDRDSIYKELKLEANDQAIDKTLKREFKNLNEEKATFFTEQVKAYYRMDDKKPFTEYMLENMKQAPFFKPSMLQEQGKETLSNMFKELEKKIKLPDLSSLKISKIPQGNLSYTIEESGELTYNSKIKEPVEYDREWITKLARMQDKLIDLRNGPVEEMIETAKGMVKGVKEAREGIVSVHKDGESSRLEFGSGISSFKEGLNYGHVLHNLESEYKNLMKSEKSEDQIAAINKKMDIKQYRDDIMRNANVYVKAAVEIRDKVDGMIDVISAAKLRAEANIKLKGQTLVNKTKIKDIEKGFKTLSSGVVEYYKALANSVNGFGKGVAMIGSGALGLGKETLALIHNKSAIALNEFKDKYNDVVKDAKIILSGKEYAKEVIAEKINDFKIAQTFNGISSNDFYKIADTRFWCELDKAIAKGKTAERINPEDRTNVDLASIKVGEQASLQKEQNLFIAERLNTKMKEDIMKDDEMTPDRAVEFLAAEYHQASEAFNVMNGASSIKSYQDLSNSEKDMCKDMVKGIINEMPNVSNKLRDNLAKVDLSKGNTDRLSVDKLFDEESR